MNRSLLAVVVLISWIASTFVPDFKIAAAFSITTGASHSSGGSVTFAAVPSGASNGGTAPASTRIRATSTPLMNAMHPSSQRRFNTSFDGSGPLTKNCRRKNTVF